MRESVLWRLHRDWLVRVPCFSLVLGRYRLEMKMRGAGAWLVVGASNGVTCGTSSTKSSLTSSKVRSGRGGRGARFGVGGGGGSWSAQRRPTSSSPQQIQDVPVPGRPWGAAMGYRCIGVVWCDLSVIGQRYWLLRLGSLLPKCLTLR